MWKKFTKAENQLWEMELGFKFDKAEWEVKSNELRVRIIKDKKGYGVGIFINPATMFHLGRLIEYMKIEFREYFGIENKAQGFQTFSYTAKGFDTSNGATGISTTLQ